MASRVNTKLVVALIVGVVLVCAVGIGLYSFVLQRGPEDNVREGDKAMVAGDYTLAKRMYGRAVNKDPNNVAWIGKWRSAMEKWQADTDTAYANEFNTSWIGMLRATAYADATNVDAADEYLELRYRLALNYGLPPSMTSMLDQDTTALVSLTTSAAPENLDRNRLRRYRAFAAVELERRGQTMLPADRARAREDLLAALDADPENGKASVMLSLLEQTEARNELTANRWSGYTEHMKAAREILTNHLAIDPDDPEVMESLFLTDLDVAIKEVERATVGAARRAAVAEAYAKFLDPMDKLYSALSASAEPLTAEIVELFSRAESAVDSGAELRRTLGLARMLEEQNPQDASVLSFLAEVLRQRGDFVEAMAILDRITALPRLPVGLDGVIQGMKQTQAYQAKAELALSEAKALAQSDTAASAAALDRARGYRDEYAKRVPEGDLSLLFIDGMLRDASGDLRGALADLQRYNQMVPQAQTAARLRGLWLQGQVASKLGEHGRARSSFQEMLTIQPENPSAIAALGASERALQNYPEALAKFREAATMMPGNEYIAGQVRELEILTGQTTSTDPVEQALAEAHLALMGSATNSGSVRDAMGILEKAIQVNGHKPRLARELGSLYMGANELDKARQVISLASEENPEDEMLKRVLGALQQSNMLDANLALVDSSPISDVEKCLNRYQVYKRFDESEKARAELTRAGELDPKSPMVAELRFMDAMANGEVAAARKIFADAQSAGILGDDALVYKARLEVGEGRTQDAIVTLTQAIERGATQAGVYRLRGMQYQAQGLNQKALEDYEKAYQIKPDDVNNGRALALLLVSVGRGTDALEIARTSEQYGREDPGFMNLWLSLESQFGGADGLARAVTVREQIAKARPTDRTNQMQLAQLYIDVASKTDLEIPEATRKENWKKARSLIDSLKAENNDLGTVVLEAKWLADQGRVPQADGTTVDGLDAARGVFVDYIIGLGDQATAEPYMELAAFMMMRGRYGVAESALLDAKQYQGADLSVEKVLGMLYMQLKEFRSAGEAFRTVVEAGADDESSSNRVRYIEMLLKTGEYQEAVSQIDQLPDSMKDQLTTLLQRAEAQDGLGRQAEAKGLFDRAVALFPGSSIAYTRRAEYRLRDPNLIQDVLADLGQALAIDPKDTQTLQLRASVYAQQKRYDEALADLTTALRADTSNTRVLVSVMMEYLLRKDDGRAMDIAEEAIRSRPRDLMLIATAAKVFEDRDYWVRSASLYKRGWDMSGDASFGLKYINSLVLQTPAKTREAEQVIRQLRAQADAAAGNWAVDYADAAIKFKKGERAAAEGDLERLFKTLAGNPNEVATWWNNTVVLYGKDLAGRVALTRRMVANTEPGTVANAWATFFLAQSLASDKGTLEEGITLFESLEALGGESPFARLAYRQNGSMLYSAGRYEEAVAAWTAGLDVFPGDWEMCNNAAFALATDLNRVDEALAFALSAVEAAPQQAEAHDSLARVYIGLGEFEKADESLALARRYASNERSSVSITITQAELDIGQNRLSRARRTLERLRLAVALIPDLRDEFGSDIEALLRKIDSLGG